jgi:hypothetical protein
MRISSIASRASARCPIRSGGVQTPLHRRPQGAPSSLTSSLDDGICRCCVRRRCSHSNRIPGSDPLPLLSAHGRHAAIPVQMPGTGSKQVPASRSTAVEGALDDIRAVRRPLPMSRMSCRRSRRRWAAGPIARGSCLWNRAVAVLRAWPQSALPLARSQRTARRSATPEQQGLESVPAVAHWEVTRGHRRVHRTDHMLEI